MPDTRYCSRLGAMAALLGAVLLMLGTLLHPMQAPPWDAAAAFAEYAADHHWLSSHLIQLLGVLLGVFALLALAWRLRDGKAGVWALFGAACAVASLALAFVLQAVDGVALKLMVDQWTRAEEPLRSQLFAATFGVRQIEAGLAALFGLSFATSLLLYAPALWLSRPAPRGLALGVLLAGGANLLAALLQGLDGFSERAMSWSMPASLLALLWFLWLALWLWRHPQ
ncbi:hypothetical protein [Pseudomonas sp. Gutcm_11s]|uniref:hypothetical protein n=1 Tax=Pseudomonas sp. Gutcm_11s TaxID=3026088 RepID=UPI00235FF2A8|nr:hypothetical protein [Pseudomonas sp. Gutcm_11s]MDD0844928.1 hypothetical protein [Pseudomonas sp. Gutcm_11s]